MTWIGRGVVITPSVLLYIIRELPYSVWLEMDQYHFFTEGWEYKYLHFSTHRHWVLHKAIILIFFFPQTFCFWRTCLGMFFFNTFHFFWLEIIKIRDVKMTERDPGNLIILQYLLPCIQRPSIVCTHSKTVKLVQHLKSIQLINCCLDCYLVNLTKPTEMSLLTIMWKNMCGLHCWHTFFLMQTSKRAVCTEGSWHSNDLWSSLILWPLECRGALYPHAARLLLYSREATMPSSKLPLAVARCQQQHEQQVRNITTINVPVPGVFRLSCKRSTGGVVWWPQNGSTAPPSAAEAHIL